MRLLDVVAADLGHEGVPAHPDAARWMRHIGLAGLPQMMGTQLS